MIAYTGSAAQYHCVLLLWFCFCGFGMFAYCLPVCDMSIIVHANANKQGTTAPLQAGSGESLKCAVPPLDKGNECCLAPLVKQRLASMAGEFFDRVDRGGEGRTLLY